MVSFLVGARDISHLQNLKTAARALPCPGQWVPRLFGVADIIGFTYGLVQIIQSVEEQ